MHGTHQMLGIRSKWTAAAMLAAGLGVTLAASVSRAATSTLLNDTWADGDFTNTNLPTDSPDYSGISDSTSGSLTATAGKLAWVQGGSSQKLWTYFTSDNSAPDGNQPHNSVTQLSPGDTLTASASFTMPDTITTSTSRNFRFGLFFDPTDPRVQENANSDSGGDSSPWSDAMGYAVELPITATGSGSDNLLQIGKRSGGSSSLLGSSSAYTFASSGGTTIDWQSGVDYTVQLSLTEVSASEMDVTASVLQGSTVLSTVTQQDLGATFGGESVPASMTGSQSIYTNFDQLFFRESNADQTDEYDFNNFKVTLTSVPEPASLGVLGLAAVGLIRRRKIA